MAERTLRILNKILDTIIAIVLILAVLYSVYSLWDNYQLYQGIQDLQTSNAFPYSVHKESNMYPENFCCICYLKKRFHLRNIFHKHLYLNIPDYPLKNCERSIRMSLPGLPWMEQRLMNQLYRERIIWNI